MSEADFKEIGITSFGQRRRLSVAIKSSVITMPTEVNEPPEPVPSSTECPLAVPASPQKNTCNTSQMTFPVMNQQRKGSLSVPTDYHIETVLNGSEDGKRVLAALQKGKLPNPERKILVRLCVSFLVDKIGHMYPTSVQKEALAKAIVQQCAGTRDMTDGAEGHEHYYCNGHGFIEYRLKTLRVGQPNVRKTTKRAAPSLDLDDDDNYDDYASGDLLEKVEWMKHQAPRRETTTTIHSYFRDTHKYRRQLLQKSPTITEILKSFPRFRDMPDLINIEYEMLWPEGSNNFLMKWHHTFSTKIINIARSQSNPTFKFLVDKFQDGNTDLCALELVATLLPSTNYIRSGRSTATSRAESLQSLIQIQPNGTDINKFVQTKEELQPFLLCLGSEINPTEFYLVCDKTSIPAGNNIVQSFDRLFKSFFVFSVQYPPQLLPFYNFFAKVVYKNKFPSRVLSQVRALSAQLGDINCSEP